MKLKPQANWDDNRISNDCVAYGIYSYEGKKAVVEDTYLQAIA